MVTFLMEIGAAVIGGVLLITVTGMVSVRARWILTAAVARWLDLDIEFVFRDKAAAAADLMREIEEADSIRILAGRGNELQRDTFGSLYLPGRYPEAARILLPDCQDDPSTSTWIAQRERELASFDPAFGTHLLSTQVSNNIEFLRQHVAKGTVALRLFNAPHLGRMIITDRYLYFTPYLRRTHGRHNHVYKLGRGELYNNFCRFFDQLWEVARPVPAVQQAIPRAENSLTAPNPEAKRVSDA
jgi:hypothetical protein